MNRFAAGMLLTVVSAACGDAPIDDVPANERVREEIERLAPAANIGHRGTGVTRAGHAQPENSISSFVAAMAEGADGIELDVEITEDGKIIVMHDDDVDRTTDCTGCVSALTFGEIRACRLLDGDGQPTNEHPPTLAEVYAAVPSPALVNVELKVYGEACATPSTGADALVQATLVEIEQLGVEGRTLFSSFSLEAATFVKEEEPEYYSALLYTSPDESATKLADALAADLDAIHPFFPVAPQAVSDALEAGLQVNVWTVNFPAEMEANLDKGVNAIITDMPAVLAEILAD